MPTRVWCIGDQAPIQIRCAIGPPHRSTLTQRALGRIHCCAGAALCFGIVRLQGGADLPARVHELFDQFLSLFRRKLGKRMYVRPQARGRGLARRIIETLEAKAVEQGCRNFMLETGPTLTEALMLYERLGYQYRGPFGE